MIEHSRRTAVAMDVIQQPSQQKENEQEEENEISLNNLVEFYQQQ